MPVPVATDLKVRRVVLEERTIWVEAEGRARGAACPTCGQRSDRVHGRYTRRPAGAPWHGSAVRYLLTVRSFCCTNPGCPRTTFTEDFGTAAWRRARWTPEARRYLQHVVELEGAEAGARVATAAGLPVSPDTLLRLRSGRPTAGDGATTDHPDQPAGGADVPAAADEQGSEPAPVCATAAGTRQ